VEVWEEVGSNLRDFFPNGEKNISPGRVVAYGCNGAHRGKAVARECNGQGVAQVGKGAKVLGVYVQMVNETLLDDVVMSKGSNFRAGGSNCAE